MALYGMVWYGMIWYGMVWYGMVWVWYGMVWYGMVWVWYSMAWHGMVWYGMVWFGMHRSQPSRIWRDSPAFAIKVPLSRKEPFFPAFYCNTMCTHVVGGVS